MKLRNKMAYLILGLLSFLPIAILVVVQSLFALEASYDSKLTIDADRITVTEIIMYDSYNNVVTDLIEVNDVDGKPIVFSIIEATNEYILFDFHGGKIENTLVTISAIQFRLSDNSVTELLNGVVYLRFKNVDMTDSGSNSARDAWLRDFIEDINVLYKVHFQRQIGTISILWVKIITASVGTLIGLVTVLFVILRKSTKALVKRYWRVAVLVALIEGTIILGFIAWIVTDIFQVFAATTVGWLIFMSGEYIAIRKGYIDSLISTDPASDVLTTTALTAVKADIDTLLAKYRK